MRETHAMEGKKSRGKKLNEDPVGTRAKHAMEEKKSRGKKLKEDPDALHLEESIIKGKSEYLRKKSENQLTRRKRYFDAVRDGLIYSCVCCKRRKFRKSVYVYKTDDPKISEVVKRLAIGELNP